MTEKAMEAEVKLCEPCKFRQFSSNAIKYCLTCQESQCLMCSQIHVSSKATRAHLVLDIKDLNQESKTDRDLEAFQKCPKHAKETGFFCSDHNHFLCSTCLLKGDQLGCNTLVDLSTAGMNLVKCGFDKSVQQDLAKIEKECKKEEQKTTAIIQSRQNELEALAKSLSEIKIKLLELMEKIEHQIDDVNKSSGNEMNELRRQLECLKHISIRAKENKDRLQKVIKIGSKADIFRCVFSITGQIDSLQTVGDDREANIYKHVLHVSPKLKQVLDETEPVICCHEKLSSVKTLPKFPSLETNKEMLTRSALILHPKTTRSTYIECIHSSTDTETENDDEGFDRTKDYGLVSLNGSGDTSTDVNNIGEVGDEKQMTPVIDNEINLLDNDRSKTAQKGSLENADIKSYVVSKCLVDSKCTDQARLNEDKTSHMNSAVKSTGIQEIRQVSNIMMLTPNEKPLSIEGISTLSDGRMIVSDKNGCRIILFNQNFKYCLELELIDKPGSLTCLPADMVAVCLPKSNKITIITVEENLQCKRSISTLHQPRKNCTIDENRLFVSMTDSEKRNHLNVISTEGTIIVTVKTIESVLEAACISSTFTNQIRHYLIACRKSGQLYGMRSDGKEVFRYAVKSPSGINDDETGRIYVVEDTGILHVLTSTGELVKKAYITKQANGLTYNDKMKRIVVTQNDSTCVCVYNIQHKVNPC